MATVIRVKRKRLAEPAEALLLACKKTKLDENFKGNSGMADIIQIEEKVFHFATTVGTDVPMDESVKEKVKNAILLRNKLKTVYGKKGQSQTTRQPLLEKKCPDASKNKLKIIGFPQKHDISTNNSTQPSKEKCSRRASAPVLSSAPEKTIQHRHSVVANKSEKSLTKPFSSRLLDIEEEMVKDKTPPQSEDILCNSVKMLREKLHVSEPSKDEYVYDLYFCQKTPTNWNVQDILYVKPCKDADFLYDSSQDLDSQKYEDEDDSNDEDNWRNDYPDEEDSIDDDERRFIFDEEEDFYDSDECDASGRDDDDAFNSFFNPGSNYDDCGNFDDVDHDDNYDNSAINYDPCDDYNNDGDYGSCSDYF